VLCRFNQYYAAAKTTSCCFLYGIAAADSNACEAAEFMLKQAGPIRQCQAAYTVAAAAGSFGAVGACDMLLASLGLGPHHASQCTCCL
jgi:hypothetical protein